MVLIARVPNVGNPPKPVPETLHDNMPALYTNLRPDSAIIQRVEVIKGSSSSLYGSSWPGGIVNMLTKSYGPDAPLEKVMTLAELENVRRAAFQVFVDPRFRTLSDEPGQRGRNLSARRAVFQ